MSPFNSAASFSWWRSTRWRMRVQDLVGGADADIGGDQRELQLVEQVGVDFLLALERVFERGDQPRARLLDAALQLFEQGRLLLDGAEQGLDHFGSILPAAPWRGLRRHTPSGGPNKLARGRRPVSRFLYPCGRQSFIWAGHYCPALATYPGVRRSGPLLLPYLVLLRVGFAMPAELLLPRCALTAPFHPYRAETRRYIFCCTFRRALRTLPAVSRHAALWRPDFPPPIPGATARPAAP